MGWEFIGRGMLGHGVFETWQANALVATDLQGRR
jgi:hypothetical protein